jgi:hypothetical protein
MDFSFYKTTFSLFFDKGSLFHIRLPAARPLCFSPYIEEAASRQPQIPQRLHGGVFDI